MVGVLKKGDVNIERNNKLFSGGGRGNFMIII